ncbi:ABC transporter substrate-binding protein [Cribrihabitans sp. XS_ASV171]
MTLKYTLAFATALALSAAGAEAAGSYGQCKVYGEAGTHSIDPVTDGELTVQVNLPAVGNFDGDTVETIDTGFEYCIASNIAHRLGLDKVTLKNAAFDAIVAGQTKDYDIAMAQISVTEPRKKVVDFSEPYQTSDFGVAVKAGSELTATSIKEGKVGVQAGTTMIQWAQEDLKPGSVEVFPDTSSLFTALVAGRVDAVVTSTPIVLGQVAASGGRLDIIGQYESGQITAGVYPKGSAAAATIDEVIQEMKQDGTLKKLEDEFLAAKWGRSPSDVPYWKLQD